ncbi:MULTISPECIES: metallophosphoesterase family protein [unclassified Pseudoalteromonas]|uniref:purple acid phosphatase family protein n=1 Tax=unclassified Pseudoalteromonas TaxID=194690 RepID=UPI00209769ED|nr:metallophosphoesterase family protein [Pseudoalteromonas sp. XMcav2-N]MCO7189177.1 metallophosphoesterase family protein [Pseudoalteromonas sp. XMcav2-N]
MTYNLRVLSLSLLLAISQSHAHTEGLAVHPYLQSATPTSIWIKWETSSGDESIVEWGDTAKLGQQASGTSETGYLLSRIHEVQLTNLAPDTVYFYRVRTGDTYSHVHKFRTPPLASAEKSSRILAVSDMQRDSGNPGKFDEIINQGVLPYVRQALGLELQDGLNMTLIPGDLVDNGQDYNSWRTSFFSPIAALASSVPLYPAPGNHERDTPTYFKYFHLPENGTPGYEEHWWYQDHSNIRVLSLDTNTNYRIDEQLIWLDKVLAETCLRTQTDFVFAQMHHPHKSEMWIAGETDYSGKIVERLEAFSTRCNKPSIHFFGHTHAYSRGTSRDHNHTMVNVASAGGNLDYFGEFAQRDYTEFSVSEDEYGFVMVDVTAGDDPAFELKRISMGDEQVPLNSQVKDTLTVRLNNTAPFTPEILAPTANISASCANAVATLFADPDKDRFGAAHWQLSSRCDDFGQPLVDTWYQHENIWDGVDTRAGLSPNRFALGQLEPGAQYCLRVRMRDRSLAWSDWSQPHPFTTTDSTHLTDNLLQNPGAELGTDSWQGEGPLESLTDKACGSVSPYQGERFFAVGGVCDNESDQGRAYQRVDVGNWAASIDNGTLKALYIARLRSWGGSDIPAVALEFRDASLTLLSRTTEVKGSSASWQQHRHEAQLPANTRYIDFVLTGQRTSGTDNDSYFDNLELRLAEQSSCTRVPDRGPAGVADEFITQKPGNSENLLQNPGAEAGIQGWSGAGPVESLTNYQCDSIPAATGQRFFAVGGVCNGESAQGQISQKISVQHYASLIAAGQVKVLYGGKLRNYSGKDTPSVQLRFLDNRGQLLNDSEKLSTTAAQWTTVSGQSLLLANTAYIEFVLQGTRNQGSDNDSYFDDLILKVVVD